MTNFAADLHISIYTRTSFPSISSPWNSLIRLSLIIGMYPILQDVAYEIHDMVKNFSDLSCCTIMVRGVDKHIIIFLYEKTRDCGCNHNLSHERLCP